MADALMQDLPPRMCEMARAGFCREIFRISQISMANGRAGRLAQLANYVCHPHLVKYRQMKKGKGGTGTTGVYGSPRRILPAVMDDFAGIYSWITGVLFQLLPMVYYIFYIHIPRQTTRERERISPGPVVAKFVSKTDLWKTFNTIS
jgi:hypothetical protein